MIKNFSHIERKQNLNKVPQETFDLAIVGGGIIGAGVARDAASRGLSVVLVEANDFAFGTSSRSSKLIHGGIRYLENLEFNLVFEALSERRLLFEIAPHLVHPLRFMIPIYKDSRIGMFKMGLGMWLYDMLALFEVPQMHERLSPKTSLQRHPILNPKDLSGSYVYSDAYMDDDRLVIETLRSANDLGACCINYMSAMGSIKENGRIVGLKCRDEMGEHLHEIRAKHIVSTVGPWTDEVAPKLVDKWQPRLRPSKGIHITVTKNRLPMKEAVVLAAQDTSRIIFIIPRHEMVVIGTTDTDFKENPSKAVAHAEEISYLLEIVNSHFPATKLRAKDIVSSYAGVRPLVDDNSGNEGETSREHAIIEDLQNITFVIGGKYTTYRRIAEETMTTVLKNFSLEEKVQFSKSRTKQPINPDVTVDKLSQSFLEIEQMAHDFKVSPAEVEKLVARHGGETHKLLKCWAGLERSMGLSLFIEAHHALTNTMCLNLKDFYLRRVPLFLSEEDHGLAHLEALADIFAEFFCWDKKVRQGQMDDLRQLISRELNWKNNFPGFDF